MPDLAPGPPGDPLFGHLRAFRRDVLGLLTGAARDHGDVVRFRVGPLVTHLVNHPEHVSRVLQAPSRSYDKQTRSTAAIAAICAESLLTATGPAWETRRRLIQPSFHRARLGALAAAMADCIEARLAQWRPGTTLDVASEMMHLTFVIVGRTVLGADVSGDAGAVESEVGRLLADVFARWGQPVPVPRWLPTPGNRRFARDLAAVDGVVARIIAGHRRAAPGDDLLSMLMAARDAESGAAFTDAELRHETVTMLLAGHETTASAVAWTLALLAQHPEAAARVTAEVRAVLGDRRPVLDDFTRLPATTAAIQEAMRLYPPIWAIERRAVQDDAIGGFAIPAGSSVIVSPYVLHRHPALWRDPERFDPSRFDAGKAPAGYLPFGAGPRYCIGHEFAMMEARLIVATTLQRFRLDLEPGHVVAPLPSLTLRLRHGLRMTPRRH